MMFRIAGLLVFAAALGAPGWLRAAEPMICVKPLLVGGVGHVLIAGTLFDGVPGKGTPLAGNDGKWDIAQFRSSHPHHEVYLLCRYVGLPADIRKVFKLPKSVSACGADKTTVVCH